MTVPWNVSDAFLIQAHDSISVALSEDLANPSPVEGYNGVRELTDWRLWRDAVEEELTRRGLSFKAIVW